MLNCRIFIRNDSVLPGKEHTMKNFILTTVLAIMVLFAQAATPPPPFADTIRISHDDLVMSSLKPGLYQYLVYFKNPKKDRIAGHSLWRREVNFINRNGKDLIEIVQHWDYSDTAYSRYVYSLSDRRNFKPLYHYTRDPRGIEAFNFTDTEVTGADSVAGNKQKELRIVESVPTLNWELDLEVFGRLPFKKVGQEFAINFYHPGGKTGPQYYIYKVIGTDQITMPDEHEVDCWKLRIEYQKDSWAIFWISRKTKEVMKMEEYFRGMYRYKVRVNG